MSNLQSSHRFSSPFKMKAKSLNALSCLCLLCATSFLPELHANKVEWSPAGGKDDMSILVPDKTNQCGHVLGVEEQWDDALLIIRSIPRVFPAQVHGAWRLAPLSHRLLRGLSCHCELCTLRTMLFPAESQCQWEVCCPLRAPHGNPFGNCNNNTNNSTIKPSQAVMDHPMHHPLMSHAQSRAAHCQP